MIKYFIISLLIFSNISHAKSDARFQVSSLGLGIKSHHKINQSLSFEASLQASPFLIDILPNQSTNQNNSLKITKKTLLQSIKLGVMQNISKSFLISTGVLVNNNKENLTGSLINPITFNNLTIDPKTAGKLTGEITYPNLGAYLSFLWDIPIEIMNSNLIMELGIAYQGKPSLSLSGDGTLKTIQS